jgi:hypothetical protein
MGTDLQRTGHGHKEGENMKIEALSPKPRNYVLKSERGKPDHTTWLVKSLSRRKRYSLYRDYDVPLPVEEEGTGEKGAFGRTMSQVYVGMDFMYGALHAGLAGWGRLFGGDGKEVAFSKDVIDNLPEDIVMELANEILGNVTEEEEKNSEAPSS